MYATNRKGFIVWAISAAAILAMILLSSCKSDDTDSSTAQADIYVDIAPVSFFVTNIAGNELNCKILIGSGQDPHTFSPTIRQISDISGAKLFISAAMPLGEQIAEKIVSSGSKTQTMLLFEHIPLIQASADAHHHHHHAEEAHDDHDDDHDAEHHDDEDEHHDEGHLEGLDMHFWMSVKNAIVLTDAITEQMCSKWPQNANIFQENAKKLKARLGELDKKLTESLKPYEGKSFYVFHPAFGYFARDYHMVQKAIEFEGKAPTPRKLTELVTQAKAEGVKVIFTQPQFSLSAAETIASQINATVVAMDPLSGDYIANMETLAEKIAASHK